MSIPLFECPRCASTAVVGIATPTALSREIAFHVSCRSCGLLESETMIADDRMDVEPPIFLRWVHPGRGSRANAPWRESTCPACGSSRVEISSNATCGICDALRDELAERTWN